MKPLETLFVLQKQDLR